MWRTTDRELFWLIDAHNERKKTELKDQQYLLAWHAAWVMVPHYKSLPHDWGPEKLLPKEIPEREIGGDPQSREDAFIDLVEEFFPDVDHGRWSSRIAESRRRRKPRGP